MPLFSMAKPLASKRPGAIGSGRSSWALEVNVGASDFHLFSDARDVAPSSHVRATSETRMIAHIHSAAWRTGSGRGGVPSLVEVPSHPRSRSGLDARASR